MTDEKWGTYGAYQEAASAMLAALKIAHGYVVDFGYPEDIDAVSAAIAQAEAAGISDQ